MKQDIGMVKVVKDIVGNILSEEEDVKKWWKEYF